jgi:predicted molibdopterin-dependent oxidoreductase YjgC
MSETAELADVVLPSCCFGEKDGTFTNTERRVQRVRSALRPPGEAREDWRIVCDISSRMGYPMDYPDAAAIQEEIASLTPIYGGITYDRIEGVGLQWPCLTRDHPGTKFLHQGCFTRGRGKFYAARFRPPKETPDSEYPFILTTGRLLEHWHTGTMTRRCTVLDYVVPHGTLELNPEDARRVGAEDGTTVAVISRRGRIEIPVAVTQRVAEGTVFLSFHFREHPANALTIAALDPVAKIPELKACAVRIEKL